MSTTDTITRSAAWDDDPRRNTGPRHAADAACSDAVPYPGPVAQPRGRSYRLEDPTPTTGSTAGRAIAITVGAVLAAVGLTAGIIYGLSGPGDATPAPQTGTSAVTPATGGGHAATPAHGGGSGGHVTPPPATPSAAIETLQKELGQLDYYEGPVTGFMNTRTTQAITYLQRDAHLPRTGTMDAATRAALAHMLVTGNNQMGD
ncbi:peptidoglycan-binding domain-containing protein [Pseudonocardia xishanensis]